MKPGESAGDLRDDSSLDNDDDIDEDDDVPYIQKLKKTKIKGKTKNKKGLVRYEGLALIIKWKSFYS